MTVADDLAARIRIHAAAAREENPLFRSTLAGRVTPAGFAIYLANIRYLIAKTISHLKLAHSVAKKRGRLDLAAHFEHKIDEETGHELWADQDRQALRARFEVPTDFELLASMRRLVTYIEHTIESNPARYLSYMLFAEYYTVLAAPEWLVALDEHCGIPTSMVSVISKHIELDQAHAAEGLREIDELIEPVEGAELIETLLEAMRLMNLFFAEVADECEKRAAA